MSGKMAFKLFDANKKIMESEERYRRLFENAPDGIVVADPKFCCTDVNENLCRMLGYTRDELIGIQVSNFIVPTERPRIGDGSQLFDASKTKFENPENWRFQRKDGSIFVAEVLSATMPDSRPFAVIRDITERIRAEKQLAQMTRLYATLSQVNQTIVRVKDRGELFRSICDQAVNFGGLPPRQFSPD